MLDKEKLKKNILFAGLILGFVLIDQISKMIIRANVSYLGFIEVIPNFFYLTYSLNYGALNGSLQHARLFLILITVIALAFFVFLSKNIDFKKKRLGTWGLLLVISGTIGNFIDRLFFGGGVTDFLMFYPFTKGHDWFLGNIFSFDPFPTFNFADICLTIGVIMYLVYIIFFDKSDQKTHEEVIDGNN